MSPFAVEASLHWMAVALYIGGTVLRSKLFFRLRARATAWGTLACFVVSVLTVFIFPFLIPSLHSAYFQ